MLYSSSSFPGGWVESELRISIWLLQVFPLFVSYHEQAVSWLQDIMMVRLQIFQINLKTILQDISYKVMSYMMQNIKENFLGANIPGFF